jgi:hypothetical protein
MLIPDEFFILIGTSPRRRSVAKELLTGFPALDLPKYKAFCRILEIRILLL